MRITNKIIQNNSLSNINTNKLLEDKYNTQMSTGKKIIRPSDDPVIAIRSLRLRTTYSEITQYRDKNTEDADSWLTVTEDAIDTVIDVVTSMIEEFNTGANKYKQSADRKTILDNLRELRDEIYATGDADYAGRGLFTGYRTSTKLRFQDTDLDRTATYQIVEKVTAAILDDIVYVKTNNSDVDADGRGAMGKGDIGEINEGNYNNPDYAVEDTDIFKETVHRLRLSYDNLDFNTKPTIQYYNGRMGGLQSIPVVSISKYGEIISDEDGNPVMDTTQTPPVPKRADPYLYAQSEGVLLKDAAGNPIPELDENGNPVTDANGNPVFQKGPCAVYIPETGELILNDKAYDVLSATRDYSQTKDVDESQIFITYNKSSWDSGDLRPEHYFACTKNPGQPDEILHNIKKTTDAAGNEVLDYVGPEDQIISYDVGFNQELRVNTLASEVYTHAIGRDVEDVIATLEQVQDIEATIASLTDVLKDSSLTQADKDTAEKSLKAAEKALSLLEDKLQVSFGNGITRMNAHLKKSTLAMTAVGTRSSKLDLVKDRLSSQKTNFKDLITDNDQVDEAEEMTNLSQAKLAYDGALMATAKITENTLLNFI